MGVVLFVAVSPIAVGGVRPSVVLSYVSCVRVSNNRNYYRSTEVFSIRSFHLSIGRYIESVGTISDTNSGAFKPAVVCRQRGNGGNQGFVERLESLACLNRGDL